MGRRRRRRRGFFSRIGRAIGRVVRGVGRAVGSVVKGVARVVTAPISAAGKLAQTVFGRRRRGGSSVTYQDKAGTGFVKVPDKGVINLTINPQPAEIGDKIDVDWDNDENTNNKMLRIHIHRLAGPIPEPTRKK